MSWKATAFVKELRNGLTVTEKFALLMIAEYHRTDGRNEWPTAATLAFDCLVTERAMKRILARLEEKDFIRREGIGGRGYPATFEIVGLEVKNEAIKGDLKRVVPGCTHPGTTHPQSTLLETIHPQTVAETVTVEVEKGVSDLQRNKVLPVLEPNGKEGALLHAKRLMELCGIPNIGTNARVVKAALAAEQLFTGQELEQVAKNMAEAILRDRQRGMDINTFYFQDAKWRNAGVQTGGKHGRNTITSDRIQQELEISRQRNAEPDAH